MTTILLVDDHEPSLAITELMLKKSGYDVVTAINGADALAKIRLKSPDVVVTDIFMPVLDGFALCRELKTDKKLKNIPVIFISSIFVETQDREFGLMLGAETFILKSADPGEFSQKLHDAICNSTHTDQVKSASPELDEDFYGLYSGALNRKLQEKIQQLELTNRLLAESEARLSLIFHNSHENIALLNIEGKEEYTLEALNKSLLEEAAKVCGRKIKEHMVRGMRLDVFLRDVLSLEEDKIQAVHSRYAEAVKKRKPISYWGKTRLSSGEVEYSEIFLTPVLSSEGLCEKLLFMARDVSKRKRAEEELVKSERKYRKLFDELYDVYFQADAKGVLSLVSPSVEDHIGYLPPELIGRNLSEFCVEQNKIQELIEKVKRNDHVENFLVKLRHTDGTFIWASANVKRSVDENGIFRGFEGIFRDISELRKMEEEKEKIQAQLHHAQRMESIGTLAGGIAHDFNNILSIMLGFNELALEFGDDGKQIRRYLMEVGKAGKRAKELVQQILTIARHSEEQLKPTQISLIAHEVIEMIRSALPATIEIKSHIESKSISMGDPSQTHQLFLNLLTNAAKAMEEEGGVLAVDLRDVHIVDYELGVKPGPYVKAQISDTGVGIAEEALPLIFDPYFTTRPPGEGTGLGLAVVQGIINQVGGKITVESEPGAGTTFCLYLPASDFKGDQEELAEAEKEKVGDVHILFIDDEEMIARALGILLEKLGCTVTTCTDSLDALEKFRVDPKIYDIVITDMTMPKMTGDKLILEMRKIRSDIPVVMCTGYSNRMNEEIADRIGVDAFAYKPLVREDLVEVLKNVLGKTRSMG